MSEPDTTTTIQEPQLSWDEHATMVPVASEQDLMEQLERIAAEADADAPPLVELFMPGGSSMAIGVGRDHSVVTFIRSLEEPDYLSKGADEDGEPPLFFFHGADSEFPPGSAVLVEDAYEAMRRFYRTGERPENIDWRQD